MARKLGKRLRRKFCEELAEHGNVTNAAAAIGRNRGDLYDVKRDDPEFARAWQTAIDEFLDATVQGEVLDAAANGYMIREERRDADGKVVHRKATQRRDPRLGLRVLERRHPDWMPKRQDHVDGAVRGVLIVPPMIDDPDEFQRAFGNTDDTDPSGDAD